MHHLAQMSHVSILPACALKQAPTHLRLQRKRILRANQTIKSNSTTPQTHGIDSSETQKEDDRQQKKESRGHYSLDSGCLLQFSFDIGIFTILYCLSSRRSSLPSRRSLRGATPATLSATSSALCMRSYAKHLKVPPKAHRSKHSPADGRSC